MTHGRSLQDKCAPVLTVRPFTDGLPSVTSELRTEGTLLLLASDAPLESRGGLYRLIREEPGSIA